MIPEFGLYALVLACCLAVMQSIVGMLATEENALYRFKWAQNLMLGQGILVFTAFAILAYSFIQNDFSVLYVATHSNTSLPLLYRFCAVWGGHEGSMLLWVSILSLWGVAVSRTKTSWTPRLHSRVLSVMAILSVGFLLFILLASNPFERLLPFSPFEGRDLNPLLQDFGLVVHPPLLYLGYVGFSVAFAFGVAVLLEGKFLPTWGGSLRPFVFAAWVFLTLGIALGSWWAYYELGWGGWWFWDPVENASLMPWLTGTALIHSIVVTEKRNLFKSWTTLLAIFTFFLSLLGTFLVRSGVLTSVHAFATDPERGLFILALLLTVMSASLVLFAMRGHKLSEEMDFTLFSKESFLLLNNLLLVVLTAVVLLGTLYPLLLDALEWGKISVGPPYFVTLFIPIGSLLLFAMSIGPLLRWKSTDLRLVVNQIKWPLLASIIGMALIFRFLTQSDAHVFLGTSLALFLSVAVCQDLVKRIRASHTPWYRMSRGLWGMGIAHLGVAVTLVGITMTTAFSVERDVRMKIGDSAVVGGYFFSLNSITKSAGANYDSFVGQFSVVKDDKAIATLYPERRLYHSQSMPLTETAIDVTLWRDLYVALSEAIDDKSWAVRIYYKPFVRWIWLGALVMALGGFLAATERRRHHVSKEVIRAQVDTTVINQKEEATA